jgi:hypothetical protein
MAKNKLHSKFNEYLRNQNYPKQGNKIISLNDLKTDAINFFGKQQEYKMYRESYKLGNIIEEKRIIIKNNCPKIMLSDFTRFLCVYGVNNVKDYNDIALMEKWNTFIGQNWSGLSIFGI